MSGGATVNAGQLVVDSGMTVTAAGLYVTTAGVTSAAGGMYINDDATNARTLSAQASHTSFVNTVVYVA